MPGPPEEKEVLLFLPISMRKDSFCNHSRGKKELPAILPAA